MTFHMQDTPIHPPRIALVDYPGVQRAALYGLCDLFTLIPRLAERPVVAPEVTMTPAKATGGGPFDVIVLPPAISGARPLPNDPVLPWVRARHAEGAIAASVCVGAFWLAACGLLDGRRATTHWAVEDEFRRAFPKVRLRPDAILIDDGDIMTAGGLMAWLDLGLHLTARWYGPALSTRLARHLLVDPAGREQRHYSGFNPDRGHGDSAIARAERLVERRFAEPLTIADLAAAAGLAPRSFQRRFEGATGRTPSAYLRAVRVDRARAALEQGDDPVDAVAWSVGYRDTSAFSRAFRDVTGLTPGACRARFRATLAEAHPRPYLGGDSEDAGG